MDDKWLTVIHDFKAYQQLLLENIRTSITSVYQVYEPDATIPQEESLFEDLTFRNIAISKMQNTVLPSTAPRTPIDWQYEARFSNYDLLKVDLRRMEDLCAVARTGKNQNIAIREYDIAVNGDTILEFSNASSEVHPVLRFRVSSHMLTEASPYFARIFRSSYSEPESPLEQLEKLPSAPLKQICRDGAEVKVYRMPQLEFNKWESLTTLLQAAHMHNDKIPREVRFEEFVSIAEVCLRYQCTGPLEMSVEYRWLPAWIHKANEDLPSGFLLISYVFGLRRLFNRTSKSMILNISSDAEIESNELWPIDIKEKIRVIREAKLSQVYAACLNAVQEYVQQPNVGLAGPESALTSVPKCPRGLHQCDATNLGWLMLVYNELGIFNVIMNANNGQSLAISPQRSINGLVSHLRLMPSPPQMHSGVCNYAPAFRNALDDIYNSIKGLTFLEVSGKAGWALSKRHGNIAQTFEGHPQGVFELPAPIVQLPRGSVSIQDEVVTLRILSYIEDLEDLHAAAMIGKEWYSVYKTHELSLMRKLAKTNRRRLPDQSTRRKTPTLNLQINQPETMHDNGHTSSSPVSLPSPSTLQRSRLPRLDTSSDDQNNITPTRSPRTPLESLPEDPLTPTEVEDILWPRIGPELDPKASRSRLSGMVHNLDPESNAKFLSIDVIRIDKSLVIEDKKHLTEEHDRNLRGRNEAATTSNQGTEADINWF